MKGSIIIPVYNAASTISDTILSILNQTEKDFEVIFINDASSDNSREICEEISKKDSRFKCINLNNNYGPAGTRNIGIKEAKGDRILFVDSDDLIDSKYVERLTDSQYDNYDIVWCNFQYAFKDSHEVIPTSHDLVGEIPFKSYLTAYANNSTGTGSLWNKSYKREFIQYNNLYIDESRVYGEDWDFNFRVSLLHPKVIVIPDILYTYIKQNKSVSTKYYFEDLDSYCLSHKMIVETVDKYNLDVSLKILSERFIYNIISLLYKLAHSSLTMERKKDEFNRIISNTLFNSLLKKPIYQNQNLTKRQKATAVALKLHLYKVAWKILSI